eukprot:CAMPEP_0177652244 /NCGR_PEP_ID=MMETSP0447-20121125/13009_1 /TAXON_ID=0 /ORGANISM="Stygamoeba regulata, Strain BSH-02190019" /LENGTH=433 /DNA_ID=CAMNT_0019155441 /DNA_START=99 /DNA_END=1396 /DNA_ORIENTATION=-
MAQSSDTVLDNKPTYGVYFEDLPVDLRKLVKQVGIDQQDAINHLYLLVKVLCFETRGKREDIMAVLDRMRAVRRKIMEQEARKKREEDRRQKELEAQEQQLRQMEERRRKEEEERDRRVREEILLKKKREEEELIRRQQQEKVREVGKRSSFTSPESTEKEKKVFKSRSESEKSPVKSKGTRPKSSLQACSDMEHPSVGKKKKKSTSIPDARGKSPGDLRAKSPGPGDLRAKSPGPLDGRAKSPGVADARAKSPYYKHGNGATPSISIPSGSPVRNDQSESMEPRWLVALPTATLAPGGVHVNKMGAMMLTAKEAREMRFISPLPSPCGSPLTSPQESANTSPRDSTTEDSFGTRGSLESRRSPDGRRLLIGSGGIQLSRHKEQEKEREREKAEREKAEREKAEREKAEREKAEREKAEREKAEREKAEREKA